MMRQWLMIGAAAAMAAALLPSGARGAQAQIQISPPRSTYSFMPISIEATYSGDLQASLATLYVRGIGEGVFIPQPMRISGRQISGTIPQDEVRPPGVEFYISVTDTENRETTFPAVSPQANPHRVTVNDQMMSFFLRLVYPSSGAVIGEARPLIHLMTGRGEGGADPADSRVFLDGVDITPSCRFEPGEIFCQASWQISPGTHTVAAGARSRTGVWAPPVRSSFEFVPSAQEPLSFAGRTTIGSSYYRVEKAASSPIFMPYPLRGDRWYPELEIDGTVRSRGRSVAVAVNHTHLDGGEQPGPGRYSASLSGPRGEFAVGDYNRSWGDLALSGASVRGGRALYRHASGFEAEAAGGFTRRSYQDLEFGTGVFARSIAAARTGYRAPGRWAASLQFVDNADDPSSLPLTLPTIPTSSRVWAARGERTLRGVTAFGEIAYSRYVSNLRTGAPSGGRAWEAGMETARSVVSGRLRWRETTPSFVSLASDQAQSDYRGLDGYWSFRPNPVAGLTGSFQRYHDNTENQKASTFRFLRYNHMLTLHPFGGGPRLTLGHADQWQSLNSSQTGASRTLTRSLTANATQSLGAWSLGWNASRTRSATEADDGGGSDFASDSQGLSLARVRGATTGSAGVTAGTSRALDTGNRTRNLAYSLRAAQDLPRKLSVSSSLTHSIGRDSQNTVSNRQTSAEIALKRLAVEGWGWEASAHRAYFQDDINQTQSYTVMRMSLRLTREF